MYTVSFAKYAFNIAIHHQYSGLELTSPVYCSNGTYHVFSSQQTDTDNIMMASFGIDAIQDDFKCVLLYKLKREHTIGTNNQSSSGTASIDDIAENMYLLLLWSVRDYDHRFRVWLIECTDDFTWDEDKLWALYNEYNVRFYEDYKSNIITWLINDGEVMETRFDITYGLDYKIDIVLSEGNWEYNLEEPMKIDPRRLVLLLSMLIVLMHTVSLSIPLSFKLNIHNQCLNVDLVSPTYATSIDSECYKPPDYSICTGNTMRSAFVVYEQDHQFEVALIYRLQRKQAYKFTEDSKYISNATHLLVVWKSFEYQKLCAEVLLVECNERLDWDKDDLIDFYHKNINRFRLCPDYAIDIWSWDGNIALMITFEIMNEDRILDITISEIEKMTVQARQHTLI
jgi:hypothetical protein